MNATAEKLIRFLPPSSAPVNRRGGRALRISLALSLALNAGGIAALHWSRAPAPGVQLLLRTGEEALHLEPGGPATVQPSPPLPEIPEQRATEQSPRVTAFREKTPVDAAVDDTPPHPGADLFHVSPSADAVWNSKPAALTRPRVARYHTARETPPPPERALPEREMPEPQPAEPQQAAPAVAASAAGATSAPRGVRQRPTPLGEFYPHYPTDSRMYGEEGEVTVGAVISAAGVCQRVWVVASSGFPALDQAALDAVRRAGYQPGSRDGAAVDMEDRFIIEFRLY